MQADQVQEANMSSAKSNEPARVCDRIAKKQSRIGLGVAFTRPSCSGRGGTSTNFSGIRKSRPLISYSTTVAEGCTGRSPCCANARPLRPKAVPTQGTTKDRSIVAHPMRQEQSRTSWRLSVFTGQAPPLPPDDSSTWSVARLAWAIKPSARISRNPRWLLLMASCTY
jgi:hypothetical protein